MGPPTTSSFPSPLSSHTPRHVLLSPVPSSSHVPLLLLFRTPTILQVYNLLTGKVVRTFAAVDVVKGVEWDPEGYVEGCDKVS